MDKIRVISRERNLVQKVTGLLENNFIVTSKKMPENFSYFQLNNPSLDKEDVNDVGLIVLDLTNLIIDKSFLSKSISDSQGYSENILDLSNKNYDYALLKELKRIQIPKLLIMNVDQAELLLGNLIRYEDVVLLKQLSEELLLRVNLILNKYNTTDLKNIIIIEDMIINLEKYELSVNGSVIELTFKEFEMMKYLIQNENKVFSRNILLSKIWGYDFYGGNRTVDVHMRRIRSKLPSPYDQMFKTIRNVGYMFSQKI
ncbi:MAG: response regulator transcription factor [Actinobacteria bacterium]|nr:response regulator transcription factor [Actinomycetota bacterium]